jgi:AraC family transcriptional regulator
MNERRHVDITELYELFKERKDCYFVCCDIKSLLPINDISHKAGDLAILETAKRMEQAAGNEDIVFRIGGDEFVLLTNSKDILYAENISKCILKKNGQPIIYEGKETPLSMYAGVTRFNGNIIKYDELFIQLHNAIRENK